VKRIALIHTVPSVYLTFEKQLREVLPQEVIIHNLLDDFLATNPIETGSFTEINVERLRNDMNNAVLTGCDLVVTTCSTLTPSVELIRATLTTPVIAIDDAMAQKAVTLGQHITVLATAVSTVKPTLQKIAAEAAKAGKEVVLDSKVCTEAMTALKSGDTETHNRLIAEMAKNLGDTQVVVLAQASMAHMEAEVERICNLPTLSSPKLCMQQVAAFLQNC
jgi:Asp/Glu/hydantoin racemase